MYEVQNIMFLFLQTVAESVSRKRIHRDNYLVNR